MVIIEFDKDCIKLWWDENGIQYVRIKVFMFYEDCIST